MRRLIRVLAVILGFAALAWLVVAACVVVDETQYVMVTEFGRPVALYGLDANETGLHFKRPWQAAIAIDRRLQVFDPPAREMITGDKRNLDVASYVVWRVADPERFLRSSGTLATAEARLDERVAAALSNAVGKHPLASLASNDAKVWKLEQLTAEVLADVGPSARDELGLEVVDIRLRRFNYPLEVRPAVFDLIRSERKQVAATLRAEGDATYQTLASEADRERDAILAKADAEAERIRGQAEAETTRILNAAHERDPDFYTFLKTLEAYRAVLDEKSTVVLSAGSPLLRLFAEGPDSALLKAAKPDKAASDGASPASSNRVPFAPGRNP
jgi:membrane protease subunit HflC